MCRNLSLFSSHNFQNRKHIMPESKATIRSSSPFPTSVASPQSKDNLSHNDKKAKTSHPAETNNQEQDESNNSTTKSLKLGKISGWRLFVEIYQGVFISYQERQYPELLHYQSWIVDCHYIKTLDGNSCLHDGSFWNHGKRQQFL